MKNLLILITSLGALCLAGCGAPFEIDPVPAVQVQIACYDETLIKVGHTLTAVFADLSDNQKAAMHITYAWYRNNTAIALRRGTEHPQSDTDPLYTVKDEDVGAAIKVRAGFLYGERESVSYSVANFTTIDVKTFDQFKTALSKAEESSSLNIEIKDNFSVNENISIPSNAKVIVKPGALTIASGKTVTMTASSVFTVNSGGSVVINGTLDSTYGTILNDGTITLENGAVMTKNPGFPTTSDWTVYTNLNRAYTVKQGARVDGFIGPSGAAGAIIDNSASSELKLTSAGTELVSGAVTAIGDWALTDTLTVSGALTVAPGKKLTGSGAYAKVVVKAGGLVTGGADSLNLTEGTYTWNSGAWTK